MSHTDTTPEPLSKRAWRMRPLHNHEHKGDGWLYCVTVSEVAEMLSEMDSNDEPSDSYEIECIEMTQEQFDSLGEFDGW